MRSNHLRDCPKNICWMVHYLWLKHYLPTSCFFFKKILRPHANRLPPILQMLELLLLLSSLDNEENINPLENTNLLEMCTMFKSKNVNFQCYQVKPWIVERHISSWVHNTWFSFSFLWEQTIWIFSCGYWITTNQGINLPFGQNSQLTIIIPTHGNHTTLTIFHKWWTSFVNQYYIIFVVSSLTKF